MIGLAGVVAVGAVTALAGRTAAGPFELTFDGRHEADPESPVGFRHVGPFTASGVFCASGQARTLGGIGTTPLIRMLTCDDGSGTATALVVPLDNEHGGSGGWRIVSGTGKYERLRGEGRFTSVRTGGDPLDHGTITFRSAWNGIADLDDAPPTVAVSRATAVRLRTPAGAYSVKLALVLSDNVEGNAVSYTLRVTTSSGIELAAEVRYRQDGGRRLGDDSRATAERAGAVDPPAAHRLRPGRERAQARPRCEAPTLTIGNEQALLNTCHRDAW